MGSFLLNTFFWILTSFYGLLSVPLEFVFSICLSVLHSFWFMIMVALSPLIAAFVITKEFLKEKLKK